MKTRLAKIRVHFHPLAVKKVKVNLPATPRRRAAVIDKLLQSPSCCKILEAKGAIITPKARKQLKMGDIFVSSLSECLTEKNPQS